LNLRYLNPRFLYERRHLVPVYARNYAADVRRVVSARFDQWLVRMAECGLPLTADDARLVSLKDKHRGRRAFIIGTGPSLRIADLERLRGEITFASNRIYVCFSETGWRPTYYATSYLDIHDRYYDDIDRIAGSVKFLPKVARKVCPRVRGAIYLRRVHKPFYPELPAFSNNALRGVCWGATITYELIQLAVYMGIREMYLLGVDFDYGLPGEAREKGGQPYIVEGDSGHFHPDYARPGERSFYPSLHKHAKAYEAAKAAVESVGGRIYNATRGGRLEVFERVDFDALTTSGESL